MPRTLPPRSVRTFPQLIRWLADAYHDGVLFAISGKTGVSPALVNLWVKGHVGQPRLESIERLCDAYDLEFDYVRGLVRGRPIAGGAAAAATPPTAAESALVAEPTSDPLPLAKCPSTLDIMSTMPRRAHHPWYGIRPLTHYLCLEIRRSMLRDRLRLRAA